MSEEEQVKFSFYERVVLLSLLEKMGVALTVAAFGHTKGLSLSERVKLSWPVAELYTNEILVDGGEIISRAGDVFFLGGDQSHCLGTLDHPTEWFRTFAPARRLILICRMRELIRRAKETKQLRYQFQSS